MMPQSSADLLELKDLTSMLAHVTDPLVRVRDLAVLKTSKFELPLKAISIGTTRADAPTLVLVGGVHGLERIGSHVVLSYLQSLLGRVGWSTALRSQLQEMRIVVVPVANPVGMAMGRRSNGNGVDLMRNAPVQSDHALPFFGGQSLTPWLPYYRGDYGGGEHPELEPELKALKAFLEAETFQSRFTLALDVHSGFGRIDRVWFPFARETGPFPHLAEVSSLVQKFEAAFPHHPYKFEPQSASYCTHGDFWDYLYQLFYEQKSELSARALWLPMTLEMGSWMWIKKNPRQLFSFLPCMKAYHPTIPKAMPPMMFHQFIPPGPRILEAP